MEGMMNKIFNFFLSFVLTAFFATSTFAATKVVWWMESDATTDPVVQEFFVDAFNAEHDDIELDLSTYHHHLFRQQMQYYLHILH